MLRNRQKGRRFGLVLIATGTFTVSCALAGLVKRWAITAMAAAPLIPIGIWFYKSRLYLDDPEARAEYRQEFLSSPLSVSVKEKFKTAMGGTAIQNILRFADCKDLRQSLHTEVGELESFSILISLYGIDNILELRDVDVISTEWLAERFEKEVATTHTFTQFWDECGGKLADAYNRLGKDVLSSDKLKSLFDLEYEFIGDDGRPRATAPLVNSFGTWEQTPKSGGRHGVWTSILTYRDFVVQHLGVSELRLRSIIESCAFAMDDSIPMKKHSESGMMDLWEKGMLSTHWIRRKLRKELQNQTLSTRTLWELQAHINLRCLMERGIVDAKTVRHVFHAGIPTHICTTHESPTPSNNIIKFMTFWKDVLEQSPELVPFALSEEIDEIFRYYQRRCRDLKNLKDEQTAEHRAWERLPKDANGRKAYAEPEVMTQSEFNKREQRIIVESHVAWCDMVAEKRQRMSQIARARSNPTQGGRAVNVSVNNETNTNVNVNCPQQ